ncbi:MAG TPA: hypothetical protein VIH06_04880 [Ilumatobacteraceae bacterium]|jgi:hypothetical protein
MRTVEMRGPADVVFLRLVRSATFALAATAGLSLDDSEELALAADEACNLLVAADAGELKVTFVYEGRVAITIEATSRLSVKVDTVSELILTSMTDTVTIDPNGVILLEKEAT